MATDDAGGDGDGVDDDGDIKFLQMAAMTNMMVVMMLMATTVNVGTPII